MKKLLSIYGEFFTYKNKIKRIVRDAKRLFIVFHTSSAQQIIVTVSKTLKSRNYTYELRHLINLSKV